MNTINEHGSGHDVKTAGMVYPDAGTSASDVVKHTFDFILAIVSTAVFAIPCLIIATLIWMEDGKAPIFSQRRIGKGGRPFTLYKFRSMRVATEDDECPQLCSDHDARLTRVGRFIRDHHLDEFPQLINVLLGDMSFVGYRPEREYFIKKIMEHDPNYCRLYVMRPGLFSNATLYNGYTDTMEKMLTRLHMDLEYLDNHSLATDITIITKTTVSIICGKRF